MLLEDGCRAVSLACHADSLLLCLLCLWCGDEEVSVCEQLYGAELLVCLAVTPKPNEAMAIINE